MNRIQYIDNVSPPLPKDFTGICEYVENGIVCELWHVVEGKIHRHLAPAVEVIHENANTSMGLGVYYLNDHNYEDDIYWAEMFRLYPDNELVLSYILAGK